MEADEKQLHRQRSLESLARDIENSKGSAFILGFNIVPRHDVPCPRKGEFCGAFLPDDLPSLYPENCPAEWDACCCVEHNFVFDSDSTPEADRLRALRAHLPLPQVYISESEKSVGVADRELVTEEFSYEEIRVMRGVTKSRKPIVWDREGLMHSTLGYPPSVLLQRMIEADWVEHATLDERLMKFATVDSLKALCVELGLPRAGDKKILMQRVTAADSQKAMALTGTDFFVKITDAGCRAIAALDGRAHLQRLKQDSDMRLQGYQRLISYARGVPGSAILVEGNYWASCPHLPSIVGRYAPEKAPWLPPGDCPQSGVKPCTCWSAQYVEPVEQIKAAETADLPSRKAAMTTVTFVEPEQILPIKPARNTPSAPIFVAVVLLFIVVVFYLYR